MANVDSGLGDSAVRNIQATGSFGTAGGDVDSAKQVILAALTSGSGLARLVSQTGNAAEVAALLKLTGSTTDIGPTVAALVNEKLGTSLLYTDEWDDVVTACANA